MNQHKGVGCATKIVYSDCYGVTPWSLGDEEIRQSFCAELSQSEHSEHEEILIPRLPSRGLARMGGSKFVCRQIEEYM